MKILRQIPLEAAMWTAGLFYLLFVNPYEISHFSFCLFKNLGIDFCPGCGLGRSIACIYRGDLSSSFAAHPLGLAALALILYRIYTLIKNNYRINLTEADNG